MAVFIKSEDFDFIMRVTKFCEKIDDHASRLGLNRELVEVFKSENELLIYVFSNEDQYKSCSQSFIQIKINAMRKSYEEFTSLCMRSRNYTIAIGEELGFEEACVPFDPNSNTPELEIELSPEGHPVLKWDKGSFIGIEIWKDRGDK